MTDIMDISDAARSGRLDLLLVQKDINLPNPTLASATLMAVQKGCPVLHLMSLRKQIVGVIRNPLLKAVGFRVGCCAALSSFVFVYFFVGSFLQTFFLVTVTFCLCFSVVFVWIYMSVCLVYSCV